MTFALHYQSQTGDEAPVQQSGEAGILVYSRRPRKKHTETVVELGPTEDFIHRISRPLPTLSTPAVPKRHRQPTVSTLPPRRSQQIAKLPPEINPQAAGTVCQQLGFAENHSCHSEASKEKCARFFDKPLSKSHVTALAKLLGKDVPPDVLGVPMEDAMAV